MDAKNIDFLQLLPKFMRCETDNQGLANALSTMLQIRAGVCSSFAVWSAIDDLQESQLDDIARFFGIFWYNTEWDLEKKKECIRNSDMVRSRMGSKWALERMLQDYFDDPGLVVEEWFDYNKSYPYHFRILTTKALDNTDDFYNILDRCKRSSQALDGVFAGFSLRGTIYTGIHDVAATETYRALARRLGPAADLKTGLSHHWALGDTSMSYASSVYGDAKTLGSLTSPTAWSASGRIGGCVAGTDIRGGDYRNSDWPVFPFGVNRTLSLSLWLRMDSATSTSHECGFAIGRYNKNGSSFDIFVGFSPDRKPCVFKGGTSNVDIVIGPSALSVGWHHFVLVGNAGTLTCYCDGTMFGTDTMGSSSVQTTPSFRFGRGTASPVGAVGLNGAVDEISVWLTRALGQDEVSALYNGGAGWPYEQWN